jgi:hypothetical protein
MVDLNKRIQWESIGNYHSKSYVCGYCNRPLASERGFNTKQNASTYICHRCDRPTFFDVDGDQIPGVKYGKSVNEISDKKILKLYEEARDCTGFGAHTAAILCCRKLLMHIAVSKKAEKGKSFAYYVKYLAENNFVPAGGEKWINYIKNRGNEANHEINIMEKSDAEELLDFMEMLLKLIYEFPARMSKKTPALETGSVPPS